MARTESRTKTGIWSNDDFCKLPALAQRRYWQLYSQPNITLCGVVAYTPGRWTRQCCDDTEELLLADLQRLADGRFIIIDYDTEEVFVRSFMRNDGVWKSEKTRGAAIGAAGTVLSTGLRDAIRVEMDRLGDSTKPLVDTPSDTPYQNAGYPIG